MNVSGTRFRSARPIERPSCSHSDARNCHAATTAALAAAARRQRSAACPAQAVGVLATRCPHPGHRRRHSRPLADRGTDTQAARDQHSTLPQSCGPTAIGSSSHALHHLALDPGTRRLPAGPAATADHRPSATSPADYCAGAGADHRCARGPRSSPAAPQAATADATRAWPSARAATTGSATTRPASRAATADAAPARPSAGTATAGTTPTLAPTSRLP